MTRNCTGDRDGEATCILPTPIGPLKLVVSGGFVVEVRLAPTEAPSRLAVAATNPLLREACLQLEEYFSRRRKSFQLPIKQAGTSFQQQVWRALQAIPYGQTRSYQHIAQEIGRPKATRAVGQANNRNKILILVPCHRVIHKDGTLGGFEFGGDTKRWLLELEGGTEETIQYTSSPLT